MDKLKNYIQENREEFERYSLDVPQSWDRIAKDVHAPKPRFGNYWKLFTIAASFLLLLTLAYVWRSGTPKLHDELTEIEYYYSGQIAEKMTIVKAHFADESPVIQNMQDLDEAFATLKNDLGDNIDNQEVIYAMVENYKLKLRILEEVLDEIEEEQDEITL